jgi:hypothetical protein
MTSGIRRRFAFASASLLLSLLFALPSARSDEKPKLLYLDVDTGGSYPSILVAAKLKAKKDGRSGTGWAIDDGEFRVGVIGSTTPFPSSIALAICPSEGEDRQGGVAYTIANAFSPKNQLALLDLRTGAATLVGSPLVQEFDMMAMACSPDGTLYAIGQLDHTKPGTFNSLYKVDRETGVATRIGSTGVTTDQPGPPSFSGYFMALSFAPDGTLYGVNDGANGTEKGSTLYKLSLINGVATEVVDVNVDAVMGLAIYEDGEFFVADYTRQSKIYALDPTIGTATPILETHIDFVNNIAFKQTKPHGD